MSVDPRDDAVEAVITEGSRQFERLPSQQPLELEAGERLDSIGAVCERLRKEVELVGGLPIYGLPTEVCIRRIARVPTGVDTWLQQVRHNIRLGIESVRDPSNQIVVDRPRLHTGQDRLQAVDRRASSLRRPQVRAVEHALDDKLDDRDRS